jgi:hypothetical protein
VAAMDKSVRGFAALRRTPAATAAVGAQTLFLVF